MEMVKHAVWVKMDFDIYALVMSNYGWQADRSLVDKLGGVTHISCDVYNWMEEDIWRRPSK